MKKLSADEKVSGVVPFLVRAGMLTEPVDDAMRARLRQIVAATGDRLKVFSDILAHAPTFLSTEVRYDPKAVEKKLKKDGAADVLADFRAALAPAEPFEPAHLEELLNSFCEQRGLKKNVLVHALRVAITGSEVGLGLYETQVILGREETLRRIDAALKLARA
jgi:glutamyl-tRNA synthetase